MRVLIVPFTLFLVAGAGAASSCQSGYGPSVNAEASLDQSVPACSSTEGCASGSCVYPVLVGCGAKGECRSFPEPDSSDCTTSPMTVCGCDGKSVEVPACWMGFAPAPSFFCDAKP